MERVAEPELMNGAEQACAYASADFEEPHGRFVALLADRLPDLPSAGAALDLGCGPGDIALRFACAWPGWRVEGIDGAAVMIELACNDARMRVLRGRVSFHLARLPADGPAGRDFDLVLSNSLLHHLAAPHDLWHAALRYAAPGGALFVMDLLRPPSIAAARALVARHAADEPPVLQHDLYRSLLASYRVEEVEAQLAAVRLHGMAIEVVSDRHWIAHGRPFTAARP